MSSTAGVQGDPSPVPQDVQQLYDDPNQKLLGENLLEVASHYTDTDIATRDGTDRDAKVVKKAVNLVRKNISNALDGVARRDGIQGQEAFDQARQWRKQRNINLGEKLTVRPRTLQPLSPNDKSSLTALANSSHYKGRNGGLSFEFYAALCEKTHGVKDPIAAVKKAFGMSTATAKNLLWKARLRAQNKDGSIVDGKALDNIIHSAVATEAGASTAATGTSVAAIAGTADTTTAPTSQRQQQSTAIQILSTSRPHSTSLPIHPIRSVSAIQLPTANNATPPAVGPNFQIPTNHAGHKLAPYHHGFIQQAGYGDDRTGSINHAGHSVIAPHVIARAVSQQMFAPAPAHPQVGYYAPPSVGARVQMPVQQLATQYKFKVNQQSAPLQLHPHNGTRPAGVADAFSDTVRAQVLAPQSALQHNFQVNKILTKRQHSGAFGLDTALNGAINAGGTSIPPPHPTPDGPNKKRARTHRDIDKILAIGTQRPRREGPSSGTKLVGVRRFERDLRDTRKQIKLETLGWYYYDLYSGSARGTGTPPALQSFEAFCQEPIVQASDRDELNKIAADYISQWLGDASIVEPLLKYVQDGLGASREQLLLEEE